MTKKTRQQRRARARAPLQRRRRGGRLFLVFLTLVVLGGVGLIVLFKANPPPLTRGAIAGEHWHASLKMYICGKQLTNYPNVEGEVHSHGDGFMHIHPSTPAASGDLASLGTFLRTYQTAITETPDGKRVLTFPGGTTYTDGDRCPKSKEREKIVVTNKGKPVTGDPGAFLPHDGDAVEIVFGGKGKELTSNPFFKANNAPDPGLQPNAPKAPEEPAPD